MDNPENIANLDFPNVGLTGGAHAPLPEDPAKASSEAALDIHILFQNLTILQTKNQGDFSVEPEWRNTTPCLGGNSVDTEGAAEPDIYYQ